MLKKLRSRSGASIIFALFIFLFCAFVGASILVIASTTTGELSDKQKNDQAYYTLTSLADYLSGELTNTTFYYDQDLDECKLYPSDAVLGNTVMAMAKDVSINLASDITSPSNKYILEFSFSGNVSDTALGDDPVKAEFVMNSDYDITVTMSIPGAGSQSVYMEFKAAPFENIDHSSYTGFERVEGSAATRIPVSVTWTEGKMLTGGSR